MASYSVAEAKNCLPALIDKAIEGEEVVITRNGKPVVELRPSGHPDIRSRRAMLEQLIARRKSRTGIGITSVELLNQMYEDDEG